MKKIIFTLLFIFCFLLSVNAQWIIQNSGSGALYDVHFINPYTGWACGDGCIMKTTNSGTNWIFQNQPATDRYLMGIHPVDSNIIYCVGYFEAILKTTNGGTNWIALKLGTVGYGASYEETFFINKDTGWISGNAHILKTINGGISFDSTYVPCGFLHEIYFKDASTGLVCGAGASIYKTTNGGNIWINIPIPNGGSLGDFHKFSFVNNITGWVIGTDKKVYKTINFGSSWDSIGSVSGAFAIQSSFFSDLNTGWAGGVASGNMLFKTTNGGYNWIVQNSYPTNAFVGSIIFLNNYTGWTVGGGGNIVYTTNAGISFISSNEEKFIGFFELFQNYPNPLNPTTMIKFSIPARFPTKSFGNDNVVLKVFDIIGREVSTLVNEKLQPGTYEIPFSINQLSNYQLPGGIYFYSLYLDGIKVDTKRMVYIK